MGASQRSNSLGRGSNPRAGDARRAVRDRPVRDRAARHDGRGCTSVPKRKPLRARRCGLAVAAALCAAMASGAAFGQTAFGASSTVVFPVVASTGTFTGKVTVYNPNAADAG